MEPLAEVRKPGRKNRITDVSGVIARKGKDYWNANTIGVMGELAANLATAAYGFYRVVERYAQQVRFESISRDGAADEEWRAHLASEVAASREDFARHLITLNNHLETDQSEFLDFILNAKRLVDFAQDVFALVGEWVAIKELTMRAAMAMDAELPSRDWVIVVIGRLEILIEQMAVFFKEAKVEPDHFRA
jgi:hypothetical protein